MFKTIKRLFLFTLTTLLLTSCFSNDIIFKKYEDYIQEIPTKYEVNKKGYSRLKSYEELSYPDIADLDLKTNKKITSFRDVYSCSNNGRTYLNMASTGEQKLLVLPVSFINSDKSNQEVKKTLISNAFFGREDTTVHESVASYYNKVSYGHLKLGGEVADFYDVNYTTSQLTDHSLGSRINVSKYIAYLAVENYKKTHDDILTYDNDKDGYIDGVFIIYDYPFENSQNSLFWAYVDHMKKGEKITSIGEYNNNAPYLSTYGWASYDFLNVKNNYVDAHVYIHEMGHFFGLQDYYSDGDYQPLGFMDMMDYNLGDHNAFSKMLLNWTTPYVINDSCTIEIKPSFNSGDCILIPSTSNWNKTPYDEFILLEFYAPEGVNYYDSKLSFKYSNTNNETKIGKLFTNYGIKAYHVDSRIGYLENKGLYGNPIAILGEKDFEAKVKKYQKECLSDPSEGGNGIGWVKYVIDFPFTNSIYSHPYIQLLEASGKNSFINKNAADNSTLFEVGDDMGINTFKDFTFYNGNKLPFSFEVKAIEPNKATIEFKKL